MCGTVTIGVAGYLFLGDDSTGDVLIGINSHTGALQVDVSIARLCVAVKVACSFAMLSFVARNCIKDLLIGAGDQLSWPQFAALTIVYVGGCMLVAVEAPGVQPVLGFAGVVVVVMAFILPGVMLVKMTSSQPATFDFQASKNMGLQPSHRVIGVLYVVFGVLVGTLSLIEQVIKLTGRSSSS